MANDIKILWNTGLMEGDIEYNNGDLTREEGLETAVLISLFTDRKANADDVLPDTNSDDRRGWWGDFTTSAKDDRIGSRLWLLDRSKTDQDTINDAKTYIEEAIQWMIDDGVIARHEIEVERQIDVLAFSVKLFQSDGTNVAMKFNNLWEAQFE